MAKERLRFDIESGDGHSVPKEKRYYIRTVASVLLMLQYKENDTIRQINGLTRNISATGMMIEVDKRLPIDQELTITLTTSKKDNPIHCKGKTVWAIPLSKPDKYHCGIEFTHIEEDNKNTFLKFLCDTIYNISYNE